PQQTTFGVCVQGAVTADASRFSVVVNAGDVSHLPSPLHSGGIGGGCQAQVTGQSQFAEHGLLFDAAFLFAQARGVGLAVGVGLALDALLVAAAQFAANGLHQLAAFATAEVLQQGRQPVAELLQVVSHCRRPDSCNRRPGL